MTRIARSLSRFVPRVFFLALATVAGATPAWSQSYGRPRGVTDTVDMSGPRFGVTMLNQASIDTLLEKKNISVQPMISQFGWQFERRLYTNGDGVTMLTEWIPLVSGLDQGQRYGVLAEHGQTDQIFSAPKDKRTQDYITGRFG